MMTSKLLLPAVLLAALVAQPAFAGSCGGASQARKCGRARVAACAPKAEEAEGGCTRSGEAERKGCAKAPDAGEREADAAAE